MAKYVFTCESCKEETHKYVPSTTTEITCPKCGQMMQRNMPTISGPSEVRELVDSFTNITWNKDHQAMMKERKKNHYVNVEIPRLVEKYSLETCLENKWLVYNDKGELVINKNWTPSEKPLV